MPRRKPTTASSVKAISSPSACPPDGQRVNSGHSVIMMGWERFAPISSRGRGRAAAELQDMARNHDEATPSAGRGGPDPDAPTSRARAPGQHWVCLGPAWGTGGPLFLLQRIPRDFLPRPPGVGGSRFRMVIISQGYECPGSTTLNRGAGLSERLNSDSVWVPVKIGRIEKKNGFSGDNPFPPASPFNPALTSVISIRAITTPRFNVIVSLG